LTQIVAAGRKYGECYGQSIIQDFHTTLVLGATPGKYELVLDASEIKAAEVLLLLGSEVSGGGFLMSFLDLGQLLQIHRPTTVLVLFRIHFNGRPHV